MSTLRKILSKERFKIDWRYALGELTLIVVGILIALGINDFAKERADRQLERQYLAALKVELKNDTIFYTNNYKNNIIKTDNAYKVMAILDKQVPFPTDTIQFLNQLFSTLSINSGYRDPNVWNELQTTGNLRLLRNRKLVDKLFEYYRLKENSKDNQYFEKVIQANRELVDEIFPLETFQELSERRLKTLPSKEVFTAYFNHPEVKRNWKKLLVRCTLLNPRIKMFNNRAAQLLKLMEEKK